MRTPTLALIVSLVVTLPASAQCFSPVCGWGVSFARPVWGYGYGYSYSAVYVNPWVVAPPVVGVPLRSTPGVFTLPDDVPTSGGVDLTALRQKLAREREAEERAKANVAAAVKAGEFLVFEPGKAPPKRAEALPPPRQVPDAPQPAPALPTDPKSLARSHLQRGHTAFDAGELGRATERFAAAIAADPTLGEAHFNLVQTRNARGQYADAIDAVRAGMKSVPTWAEERFRADDLYLANPKRLTAGVADLKAAMDANPTDGTLAFLYAHHLWFGGERAKAKELFGTLKNKVKEKELVEPFTR